MAIATIQRLSPTTSSSRDTMSQVPQDTGEYRRSTGKFTGARNPSSTPNLRHNVLWTFVANVVVAACQWLFIAALARLATPHVLGEYAVVFAVAKPLNMLLNLQLRGIQATDAQHIFCFHTYLLLRWITTVVFLLSLALTPFAGLYTLGQLSTLILIGAILSVDGIGDIYFGKLQSLERLDIVSKSMIANSVITTVLSAIVFYSMRSLTIALLCSLLVSLLILTGYVIPTTHALNSVGGFWSVVVGNRFDWSQVHRLAKLAAPLGVVMALGSLNTNLPRILLGTILDQHAVGLFVPLATLLTLGATVVAALGQGTSPRLAKLYGSGQLDEFMRVVRSTELIVLGLGVAAVVTAATVGPSAVRFVYGAAYAQQRSVLIWIAVAGMFQYCSTILGYGNTAMRQYAIQMAVTAVPLVVTAGLCALLIPDRGIAGAAASVAVGALAKLLVATMAFRKGVQSARRISVSTGESTP